MAELGVRCPDIRRGEFSLWFKGPLVSGTHVIFTAVLLDALALSTPLANFLS